MTIEWCPTCGGPLRHDRRNHIRGCRLCWLETWSSEETMARSRARLSGRSGFRVYEDALHKHLRWRGREAEANSDPNDQAGTGGSFSQWLPPGMRWGIRSFAPTQDAALNMWLDHADRFTRGAPPYGDREAA